LWPFRLWQVRICNSIIMVDNMTSLQRSKTMSAIRSSGNRTTEQALIHLFRTHRITGWRRKAKMVGRPDFVFRRERIAVFVDGCFWHGCPRCQYEPATNSEYWTKKVRRNRARDRFVTRELKTLGWKVLRIWEHSLRRPNRVAARVLAVLADDVARCRKH